MPNRKKYLTEKDRQDAQKRNFNKWYENSKIEDKAFQERRRLRKLKLKLTKNEKARKELAILLSDIGVINFVPAEKNVDNDFQFKGGIEVPCAIFGCNKTLSATMQLFGNICVICSRV